MNVEGENKSPCFCFINSVKQVKRVMGSERSRPSTAPLATTARGVGQGGPGHCLPGEVHFVRVLMRPGHQTQEGKSAVKAI